MTLPNVSSKYGAPMGRRNVLPDDHTLPCKLQLDKLEWVDGDYDEGGAYWGGDSTTNIYWAYGTADDNTEVNVFVRASSRRLAKLKVLSELPNATIRQENNEEANEEFLNAYIACALWSSTDDNGTALDANYSPSDIAPETLSKMEEDCKAFLINNSDIIEPDFAEAGHDFWLTRNGHGSGFWDGDWDKEIGEQLTEASRKFGEFNLYVGDDGKIHGS